MSSFVTDFFIVDEEKSLCPFLKLARAHGHLFWAYGTLTDVLNVSASAKSSSSRLTITSKDANRFIAGNSALSCIGRFPLSFASDMKLGTYRRTLHKLWVNAHSNPPPSLTLRVSPETGSVVIDAGIEVDEGLDQVAVCAPVLDDVVSGQNFLRFDDENEAEERILKHIEVASYDEYDDFNPRHPLPRDKTHRRGDSYFNSDIEGIALEAMKGFDMSSIAALALNAEGMNLSSGSPSPKHRNHRRSVQELQFDATEALNASDE